MLETISQLHRELSEYIASRDSDSKFSVSEFLYCCYQSKRSVDDSRIRQCESAMSPIFGELSLENSDRLFDLISDLCIAYQRDAFLEGLQIGFQLSSELTGSKQNPARGSPSAGIKSPEGND